MPTRRRAVLILAALLLLALASFWAALAAGSIPVAATDVLAAVLGQDAPGADIVRQLRLPRALAGFACGGLLALAGALMQVLLRNPLADPYILGISGGAGVGALFAIMVGLPALGIDGLAFTGALGAMLLVFGLAHGDGSWTQTRLLLTGVIVAAGCGALISLMLAIAPEDRLRGMLFWLTGDLGQAASPWPPTLALAVALVLAMPFARELNLLARGLLTGAGAGCCGQPSALCHFPVGLAGHRRLGDDRRLDRLHRPRRAAPGPARHRQRPAPAAARLGAGRRRAADARRYAGTHADRAAAVAGRRVDGTDRRAGLPFPAFPPAAMSPPLLSARKLRVNIGGRCVVRSLDLDVADGRRIAVLGRNGAGKSTLLATLAGLRPPVGGSVLLGGDDATALRPREAARRRAWLGQAQADPFGSTVLETALTGRHPHLGRWDWESRHDARIARDALAAVGLAGLEARQVHTLSGGERQRLAIATLLTQAPPLYLLDEPLAHLDLNHQMATLELFSGAARQCGAGIVMVLHDPALAHRYCDEALLLHGDGRTELGSVDAVLTGERLHELYGYPLRQFDDGGHRCFLPA